MKQALSFLFLCVLSANIFAGDAGKPVQTSLIVTYADSSTTFTPSLDAKLHLEHAKEAAIIYLSGRTSTTKPSAKDEALAFKRAAAARAYLIDKGVSPLKIMVNYVTAGDYIEDNSTPWGRSQNQRVEIDMVFIK